MDRQRERIVQEQQTTVLETDFRGIVLLPSFALAVKLARPDMGSDLSVNRSDLLRRRKSDRVLNLGPGPFADTENRPTKALIAVATQFSPLR